MSLPRDILDDFEEQRRRPAYPDVTVAVGMVVEDRATGFCGDVVKVTIEAVTLRDRKGNHRHFRYKSGGFLLDGKAVSLVRPAPSRTAAPVRTASGSIASPKPGCCPAHSFAIATCNFTVSTST